MDFPDLLARRRTIRLYKQQPVDDSDLRYLLEAARLASSAANRQPLRYLVVRSPALVAQLLPLTAWAALVRPHRVPRLGESAPPVFIVVTAPADAHPEWTQADAGAAIQSIEFAAVERGLGCCWIGALQREKLAEVLELTPDRRILYLVAVGYPAEQPCHEDACAPDQLDYYLDGQNQLHVPKLPVDTIATWL
ncbi:MAG: nitroreductase family protein [Victivallales bacterium]|nr:nitroreductase family protein [Victivallales bacterium]